jgi:tRNA synthetases class II (A)
MGFDEAALDQIAPRFLAFLRDHEFTETPSAPLTAADPSVTFVNASITPFKPRLLAGDRIGRTCQVQQCLRATGRPPWLYVFDMLGALTDADHLLHVIEDVPRALLFAAPWLSADRLAVAIDREHGDLRDALEKNVLIENLLVEDVRHEDVPTQWSYGKDGRLTGRGMTFFHRSDNEPCGPGCAVGCRCGRWQELGQIIEVSSPHGTYTEAGFGLQSVQAITCGGELWRLPALRAETARLRDEGVAEENLRQTVNLSRALSALVDAEVRPGAKGGASVMRRFVRELLGCLDVGSVPDDEWAERVRRLLPAKVADLVIEEAERWCVSRRKAEAAARSYLRRHPEATEESLVTTYGLDPAQARRMREDTAGA